MEIVGELRDARNCDSQRNHSLEELSSITNIGDEEEIQRAAVRDLLRPILQCGSSTHISMTGNREKRNFMFGHKKSLLLK